MSLLGHKVVEFLFRDKAVVVKVSSLDHVLKSCIVGQFSHIFGNFSEVLECNKACIEENIPFFWESKVMKTLWTSSLDSLSLGLVVIIWKNSSKSICPLPSLSISAIIW